MPYSNYPGGFSGGVTIRGVPVTVTNPGETFWVNSTAVLPAGGKSPSDNSPGTFLEPVKTISAALDLCTASRGDIIMLMPGYEESVGTGDLAIDVAGVAIVGLGLGGNKPVISSDHTGAVINVTAANVSMYNIRFLASVANVVTGMNITGAEFSIDSCEFMSEEAADSFTIAIITTADAIGLSVTNCTFNGESSIAGVAVTGTSTNAIQFLNDRALIDGNWIVGIYSTAAIENVTTATLGSKISNNEIYNADTSTNNFIIVAAGSTGAITRNMGCSLFTTSVDSAIVNPAMILNENYIVNVLTESGGVVGSAST